MSNPRVPYQMASDRPPLAPPEPGKTPGTGQTPPAQRTEERSTSVLNNRDRLLRDLRRQQEPPRARATPPSGAPQQGGGTPTGVAALSAGETRGLSEAIQPCFSVDAGGLNIAEIVVEMYIDVDGGGVVRNVRPNGSPPSDPRARMVYERARTALLSPACNPLPLPRERLAALRDTLFRFRPANLGLR